MSHADRSSNLRLTPENRSPRTWAAMLETLDVLLRALLVTLTPAASDHGAGLIGAVSTTPIHERIWRWMWSLPPCSEARKAAFTLGAAAWLMKQWRGALEGSVGRWTGGFPPEETLPLGQRAESLLRIAAWHIDDARGEAHARTRGIEPAIPPNERVYERTGDGLVFVGQRGVAIGLPWTPDILGRAILADHFTAPRPPLKIPSPLWLALSFRDLAIASLPDGPWEMTTRDVERFLDLILGTLVEEKS